MNHQEIYQELVKLSKSNGKIPGYIFWYKSNQVSINDAFNHLKKDLTSILVTTKSGYPVIRKWLNES